MRYDTSGHRQIARLAGLVFWVLAAVTLSGCGSVEIARADTPREVNPAASDVDALVRVHQSFAFDLYHARAGEKGNVIFSPYSISTALTMVYAGAGGDTADQMASTLHYDLPPDRLYPAANALDQTLVGRAATHVTGPPDVDMPVLQLNVASSVWSQKDYAFEPDYLDTLARSYDAGVEQVDFGSPYTARNTINRWISDQTKGHIKDIAGPGTLTADTRLVLANAIYFYGPWDQPFEPGSTRDGAFTRLDGRTVSVPMMTDIQGVDYLEGEGYEAIGLRYKGGDDAPSMLILMPDVGQFDEFEQTLDAGFFNETLDNLSWKWAMLTMPRFEIEYSFNLIDDLARLGMPDAFDSDRADFSGLADMAAGQNLLINTALHKTTINVAEKGTEAAASSLFASIVTSGAQIRVEIDHPFLFAIYDQGTGEILFLGRVLDPTK